VLSSMLAVIENVLLALLIGASALAVIGMVALVVILHRDRFGVVVTGRAVLGQAQVPVTRTATVTAVQRPQWAAIEPRPAVIEGFVLTPEHAERRST
jgi:hypothetical protein